MTGDQQPGPEVAARVDEVTGALSDLARVLEAEEDLGRVLQRSVEQVTTAVPAAELASVTVLRDGKGQTAAASSARVQAIDEDQYAAGDGPCLQAARTRQTVRTSAADAGQRQPAFPQRPGRGRGKLPVLPAAAGRRVRRLAEPLQHPATRVR